MFKIENEFKSANISRTVRFTEPLFERLNKVAAENDISFNLLVLQCCKYALDNQEQEWKALQGKHLGELFCMFQVLLRTTVA